MRVALAGQVALIAGGETGLGAALEQALVRNGATVEAVRTPNFSDATEWGSLLEQAVRRNGALNVLIDALALSAHAQAPGEFSTLVQRSDALSLAAGELMAKQGGGRIVTLLSVVGLLPARGEQLLSATHAALAATIRSRAMELAPRGVVVNGLAVGPLGSNHANLISHVPLARSGTMAEIAAAALFLADPENTYTVGHILSVDGGWQAGFARDF
jgi:NAD(P)-dependent dehydrogenase (short-subunit alcohol dehydrogenase family)